MAIYAGFAGFPVTARRSFIGISAHAFQNRRPKRIPHIDKRDKSSYYACQGKYEGYSYMPAATSPASSIRKEPTQQRSRERVERMLAAARDLIAQYGSDAMRMSEVAERAGVSIGSLYQFFPDKSAIIRALAERFTVENRACIDAELAGVSSEEDLLAAFARLIDAYYTICLAEPVMREIWSGTQVDKTLRELELADSRASAESLAHVWQRLQPEADPVRLTATAFLVWQLGEATMRLAISVDRAEGDRLVEIYKRMALRELMANSTTPPGRSTVSPAP